jgi:hypothetical protein
LNRAISKRDQPFCKLPAAQNYYPQESWSSLPARQKCTPRFPHVTFVLCGWHLSELTYWWPLATFMAAFRCSPKVQFALAVWGDL